MKVGNMYIDDETMIRTIELMAEEGEIKHHHTATRRGYVSRKKTGEVELYKGRYGTGYIIKRPRWDSTNYVYYDYYIIEE